MSDHTCTALVMIMSDELIIQQIAVMLGHYAGSWLDGNHGPTIMQI